MLWITQKLTMSTGIMSPNTNLRRWKLSAFQNQFQNQSLKNVADQPRKKKNLQDPNVPVVDHAKIRCQKRRTASLAL